MKPSQKKSKRQTMSFKSWLFPLFCVLLYIPASLLDQGKCFAAVEYSLNIMQQILVPIFMAITVMILLNRYLSPSLATKILGSQSGFLGIILSSFSGIVSTGPIYAWYPLLTTLKEKGISTFHIANFITCRSIKPFLVPILLAYFGLVYTLLFLSVSFLGALLCAACVAFILSKMESKNN